MRDVNLELITSWSGRMSLVTRDDAGSPTVTSLPVEDQDLWEEVANTSGDPLRELRLLAHLPKDRLSEVRELVLQRGFSPSAAVDAVGLIYA